MSYLKKYVERRENFKQGRRGENTPNRSHFIWAVKSRKDWICGTIGKGVPSRE